MATRVRQRWLALASMLLLGRFAACGGDVSDPKTGAASAGTAGQPPIEAGSAGVDQADADAGRSNLGAGGVLNDGDSGSAQGGALAASAAEAGAAAENGGASAGASGSGGAPVSVHLSGTHACSNQSECFSGLSCRGRANRELTLCLAPCESDFDCSPIERCIHPSDPFGPDVAGCFLTCDASPLDCPLIFNCEDPSGLHAYTCLPRGW